MNRHKLVLALAVTLILLVSMVGTAGAAATITPSTETPIVGEEITFTVGTTMEGMEATISTTGLTYVSNTGLGNTTHAITVPGVGSAYTYRVSAAEGETVSFVLSDVQEADDQGNEVAGQRVTWMASAQRAAAPTQTPQPSTQPSDQPSQEPSPTPTQAPSAPASEQPSQAATPAPSGNPSPTINPSQSVPPATTTTTGGGNAGGTTTGGGGNNAGGGTSANPPRTGDISHFWIWVGIGAVLTLIVIAAGKRVFAD